MLLHNGRWRLLAAGIGGVALVMIWQMLNPHGYDYMWMWRFAYLKQDPDMIN